MIAGTKESIDETNLIYKAEGILAKIANESASYIKLNKVNDNFLLATKIRLWLKALDYKSYLTRAQREKIWYALIDISGAYDKPNAPTLDTVNDNIIIYIKKVRNTKNEISINQISINDIDTSPFLSDVTINYGENAVFSISVKGNNRYQWQTSYDFGDSWFNLTDSYPYSGTNSRTLTITQPSADFSGRYYKVIITNLDYSITIESNYAGLYIACINDLMNINVTDVYSPNDTTTVTLSETSGTYLPEGNAVIEYSIDLDPSIVPTQTSYFTVTSTGGIGGSRGGSFTISGFNTTGGSQRTIYIYSIASEGCTKILSPAAPYTFNVY